MPRRREVPKREMLPDPKYGSKLVAKFINNVMRKGKRSVAEKILYESFDIIAQRSKQDPMEIFKKALDNVKPVVEVKSRRVGGSTYQVPVEVRSSRRVALGIRWLINHAQARSEKSMTQKLAGELLDVVKAKLAEVNQPYL